MFKIKYTEKLDINIRPAIGTYFRYTDDEEYYRVVHVSRDNWACRYRIIGDKCTDAYMSMDSWVRCIANREYIIVNESEVPLKYKVPLMSKSNV